MTTRNARVARPSRDLVIAAPAPAAGEEGRAFPIFRSIPPCCTSYKETSMRHWPHVKPEETVLVDTREREIVWGELYLISQTNGPTLWQVTRATKGATDTYPAADLRPLNNPRPGEVPFERLQVSDGPIYQHFLEERIIGRVIGLLQWPTFTSREQVARILARRYGHDGRIEGALT